MMKLVKRDITLQKYFGYINPTTHSNDIFRGYLRQIYPIVAHYTTLRFHSMNGGNKPFFLNVRFAPTIVKSTHPSFSNIVRTCT